MALRIKKEIVDALNAARNGETVDLTQMVIPRMGSGHMVKAPGKDAVRSFLLSDKSVDRDRDTIDPMGWDLDEFNKNGAVLWAHDNHMLPVAEPSNTRVEGKDDVAALYGDAKFSETYEFSKMLLALIDEKILKNVSVGFIPLEWTINEERQGIDFVKERLVEWSVVPVGSHPGAMVQLARSKKLDMAEMYDWATKWLDNDPSVAAAVADDVEMAVLQKSLTPWKRKAESGLMVPKRLFADVKKQEDKPEDPPMLHCKPCGKEDCGGVEKKGEHCDGCQGGDCPGAGMEKAVPIVDPVAVPDDPVARAFAQLEAAEASLLEAGIDDVRKEKIAKAIAEAREQLAPSDELDAKTVRSMVREAMIEILKDREDPEAIAPEEVVRLVRSALGELKEEILREAGRLPA